MELYINGELVRSGMNEFKRFEDRLTGLIESRHRQGVGD